VCAESIAVDPGIGFGKTFEQNLQLLTDLSLIAREFSGYPLVLGTSRKRFIGRLLGNLPTDDRLAGTMATVTAAVLNGADIVRVHDVWSAVQTVRVADALKRRSSAD
jgi:dihydropteroate synthase